MQEIFCQIPTCRVKHLREYPRAFAKKLASLDKPLKSSCRGRPPLPEDLPAAIETFSGMSFGEQSELWRFVDLESVYIYLRGGQKLNIPPEWRHLVPNAYPGCF